MLHLARMFSLRACSLRACSLRACSLRACSLQAPHARAWTPCLLPQAES